MTNYSEAIEKGVSNWLDTNRDTVLGIIKEAVQKSTEEAINWMAAGTMTAIGKFLDANSDDLKAGIALAIATSWANRQHPTPKMPPDVRSE